MRIIIWLQGKKVAGVKKNADWTFCGVVSEQRRAGELELPTHNHGDKVSNQAFGVLNTIIYIDLNMTENGERMGQREL